MPEDVDLILVGASVRAAAFSALRAGFSPWCADRFGDSDLRQRCPVQVVHRQRYPTALFSLLAHAPLCPWAYTGGLENHPKVIAQLASLRPVWGNTSAALRRVRSPKAVAELFCESGIPCPRIKHRKLQATGLGHRWLIKPRHGSGGSGIRFYDGRQPVRGHYIQEYVGGRPLAAAYVATGQKAHLLGVTLQLVGLPWLHARQFQYCGSIGPIPTEPALRQRLARLGDVLTRGSGLCGLFGVDFILRDGIPWPVEVNPRYTASMELLEYATGLRVMALHREACTGKLALAVPKQSIGPVVAKAILYAVEPLVFPQHGPWLETVESPRPLDEVPAFADIPAGGQTIPAGAPILTFFTVASAGEEDCLARLQVRARSLDRALRQR